MRRHGRKSSVRREGIVGMTLDQAADAAGGIPAMHHRGQFLQTKIFRLLGSR